MSALCSWAEEFVNMALVERLGFFEGWRSVL
jgi:hypothetical protein